MDTETCSAPTILVESVGVFETNCYFVYPRNNGPLFIIDPGGDPEKLLANIPQFPTGEYVILLTHAHVDHISGAGAVAEKLGIKTVFVSPEDQPLYQSRENALLPFLPPAQGLPPTVWPPEYPDFKVISTPGHTRGGVCYWFESLNALFSGDTLFCCSVGRSDFATSSTSALIRSIKEKLFLLPDETKVFPGHMGATTIGNEKVNNPYV